MREYRGRKVLGHIQARLAPEKNSELPDCICLILLTEDTLYVLEDVLGTYTAHYAIPCSRIKRIEKYKSEEAHTRDRGNPPAVASALAMALGGFIFLSSRETVNSEFLTIVFHDGTNENQQIFFSEVVGSINKFAKVFQRIKSRRNM